MPDFTFDLPACLTFKAEAGDEEVAKVLIRRAFAHFNSARVNLTSNARIVAVETGKDQSSA